MNRLLLGYRSSERALDHEKIRAIKKKLSRWKKINMQHNYPSGLQDCLKLGQGNPELVWNMISDMTA